MAIFRSWRIVALSRMMGRMTAPQFRLASIRRKPLRQGYGFLREHLKALLANLRYRTLPFKARACGIQRSMVCMRVSIVVETIVAILILPFWARRFCEMINQPRTDLSAVQEQARGSKISGWNTQKLAIGWEQGQMAW